MNHLLAVFYDQGKIGTLRQCEAIAYPLAKHFCLKVVFYPIQLPKLLNFSPPHLTRFLPTSITAPFLKERPTLLIAAGRKAINIGASFKGQCPVIALLNPHCPSSYFDLVIPPYHDKVPSSPNVIQTHGALHPHTLDSFCFQKPDKQYICTVLIGGNSRYYQYSETEIIKLANYLKEKFSQKKSLFLITLSRRTPTFVKDLLLKELNNYPIEIWNGEGENPYTRYLAIADEILVTNDSISMLSEACYLGKPVEIWPLPFFHKKFNLFQNSLIEHQHAVFAKDQWPSSFTPLREAERILPLIEERLTNIFSK